MSKEQSSLYTRRDFLAAGGGALAATAISGFPFVGTARAQGSEIRVGVIGCGGRGTGACSNVLMADPNTVLVAIADVAADQIDKALAALKQDRDLQDKQHRIKVTSATKFSGIDGYKKLLQADVDYVILAAPPGFRPEHYEACVNAGKHIFAEKPVGTCPAGIRRIRASAQKAKQKGLSTVVGLNYRHDTGSQEVIKRLHEAAIGEVLAGRIYRLGGGVWHRGSNPAWSQLEYQCRNWYYFDWLSGDQIVEMVVHQIDLMNWAMGGHPVSALAQGGRIQRTDPKYGNIYDNMTVDYEYANGVHVTCMLRQWENSESRMGNVVIGKLGESDCSERIRGANQFRSRGQGLANSYVDEHKVLIESIKKKDARNDILDFAADSTLTAVIGRESAYTGKLITWEEALSSPLDLYPSAQMIAQGKAPQRPVAIPGQPRPV